MCPFWQLHNHWPLLYMSSSNWYWFSKQTNTIKKLLFTCCRMWRRILTHFSIFRICSYVSLIYIDLRLSLYVNFVPRFTGNKQSGPVVFIYITKMTSLILNNLFFTFSCKCSTDDIILIPIVGNTKYFLKMSNKMYFSIFLPFWSELLI